MARSNRSLNNGKKARYDEFYTHISCIEKELKHHWNSFKGKVIYLNCDNPNISNFYRYMAMNFTKFGLKKLIATHYSKTNKSYKLEILEGIDVNKDGKMNILDTIKTPLKQNGDFRSEECIEILKEADIVVTNPPFSLFAEYVQQLMDYKKKFLIIGSINAIVYSEIFPYIKANKIWLGYENFKSRIFYVPDEYTKDVYIDDEGKRCTKLGNTCWYTNLPHKRRNDDLILFKKYNKRDYHKYDNYDAIEVGEIKNIPMDYDGVMGVPVTFLDKHNPNQFEIVGSNRGIDQDPDGIYGRSTYLNGVEKFKRLFIRRR